MFKKVLPQSRSGKKEGRKLCQFNQHRDGDVIVAQNDEDGGAKKEKEKNRKLTRKILVSIYIT